MVMEASPSPSSPKWSDLFASCISVTAAARRAVVRVDDCRILGRLVRKVHLLLQALLEENTEQDYASIDTSGGLLHCLRAVLGLVTRCCSMGRLQNFLESAQIRQDMKGAVEELHSALGRMEQEHLKVPDDVAEDLRVLTTQLQRVEFTVFPEREAVAQQLFSTILLERAGLSHDTHIIRMLKDISAKCGVPWCDCRAMREEVAALEVRCQALHEEGEHIHELLLGKVADIMRAEVLSKLPDPTTPRSPNENACPAASPFASNQSKDSVPSSPAMNPLSGNFDIFASITQDSKSANTANKSHMRRASFGAISALHPPMSPIKTPSHKFVDDASVGSPVSVADSAESLESRRVAKEDVCSSCMHIQGADNLNLDADDLTSLITALTSDNMVAMQTAAHAIAHLIVTNEFDWSALEGARMKLIRPLINILRYRHPVTLKSSGATVLRYLARQHVNRQAIADAGGIVLLMKLFKSHSDTAKQAAARAISNILVNMEPLKAEVMKAGIVEQLNSMLEALHPGTQEAAAVVLANLACNNAAQQNQIIESGSVSLLVCVLREGSVSGRQAAARALKNLTKKSVDAKLSSLEGGAVPLLLAMCGEESLQSRLAATNALASIALSNAKAQASMVSDGVLPVLVALLSDSEAQVREAAAWALSNLSSTDTSRAAIVDQNAIPALVSIMGTGRPTAQLAAATALKNISAGDSKAIKHKVAVSGALSLLAGMLGGDSPAGQKVAAGTLWNLAYKNEENRTAILESGAIPLLVRLLKSYQAEGTRLEAARAISNLSCNNTANQLAIAAAGAIAPLVHLLEAGSYVSKEAAARALSNLALLDENQEDITRSGAIPPLLALMQSTHDSCREAAGRAYGNIIVNNNQECVVSTASLAIPILKNLVMEDKQRTIQLEAARALGNLACVGEEVQTAISASGVLVVLIKMLDSGHDATREAAACALWDIAFDNDKCRMEIVALNGVPYLVQALLFGSPGTKEAAASTLSELAALCTATPSQTGSIVSSAGDSNASGGSGKRRVSGEVVIQVDLDESLGSISPPILPSSSAPSPPPCTYCTCNATAAQPASSGAVQLNITPDLVRTQIVESGAMPLLIQLMQSDDAKLHAVGERALHIMGYSPQEPINVKKFPGLSAYHQPRLLVSGTV